VRTQNVISHDKKSWNVSSLFWRTFIAMLMGAGRLFCTFTASVEFLLPSPGSALLGAFLKMGAKFSGYR